MKGNLLKASLLILLMILTGCNKNEPKFKFVFMTDIHLQSAQGAEEGFAKALKKAEEFNPDFILTGGDLIMDALGQNYDSAKVLYDMYENACSKTSIPIHNTIGNHEVFGLYKESGIDPANELYGKKMFEKFLGEGNSYRSYDHKGWHFINLDGIGFTEERRYNGMIDSIQIEWIKKDLKSISRETPIIISSHIPLASIYGQMRFGSTYAMHDASVVTNAKQILELFNGYNLQLVLQGHLHIVEEIIYQNVHYITGGAVCGGWWKGPRDGFEEGFVLVEVYENSFDWKYIDYDWQPKDN